MQSASIKLYEKMKTYITIFWKRYCIAFSLVGLLAGCDQFLELSPPKTEIATISVFSSNSTANAAITSIYARMATQSGSPHANIAWLSGLSADEFTSYSTTPTLNELYTNSLTAMSPTVASYFWTPYYSIIFQVNAIIEGLQTENEVSEAVKKQITGEAKFIRAFYHFYLLNFFGDVPSVTITDYRVNATLPRSPKSMVYEQILTDLLDAKELLSTNYVGRDGILVTPERVRPNKAVVQAFLARVYLYMENYVQAEQEATEVINNSSYSLVINLNEVFLKNSTEAIWQLQTVSTAPTVEAGRFVLSTTPVIGLERSQTLSDNLVSQFNHNDLRLANWIGNITVAGHTYMFPNKYKVTSGNTSEYSMVFRLAEQYLIRAEARIKLNKIADGLADLNVLRNRANAPLYDIEADPLKLVEHERQLELFSEGHRWFDLIRTERIDEVMAIAALSKGNAWNTHAKLFPIPENERNNNQNLTQNDGY